MSSDGRYMYHQPPITPAYDYAPYPPPPPPSSYDNSQMTQPPPRSVRPAAPSQAPSSHQSYNPPPPYPHPAYGPGSYMTHPQQPPQWSSDAWATHYQQSYGPPPPPPPPPPAEEAPYSSVPARPDTVSSSSTDPRAYSAPPPPEPRRTEDRLPPPPNPPPLATTRRRERESPPAAPSGTPAGLDFMKLLESYRLIIDVSDDSSSGPGRPPASETFERMLQAATYGAQMLESATSQPQQPLPAEVPRSPKRKEPEEVKEPANGTPGPPPAKRPKTEETSNPDGQKCEGCGATSTPEWRRGPLGPRTLCNACGLVYAKLLKKRFRETTKGTNGSGPASQGLGEESIDGDSDDDDDEYTSQGPHSEGAGGHRD